MLNDGQVEGQRYFHFHSKSAAGFEGFLRVGFDPQGPEARQYFDRFEENA